jgi:hypothetical protein
MALLRFSGVSLVVLVELSAGAFYVLVNQSVTKLALTCTGSWVRGAPGVQGRVETVVAVIEEYRPWIIWTESDGNLRAESRDIPMAAYFSFMRRIGDEPMATYWFNHDSDGATVGSYRGSFRELTLQFAEGTVFTGPCS